MQNQTNTNTANTTSTSTMGSGSGGSDIGGLSRQLLGQQAEILAKIEVLIENQNRLELALQVVRNSVASA